MNVIQAVCFLNTTFRYKLSGFSNFTSRGLHYRRLWLSLRLSLQSCFFPLQRNLRRCQTHLSASCSNLRPPWKEKEQKIFKHILVHALLATALTSLSTGSWFVRLPLSGLPVFATCLHQSLAIMWHCLSCSSFWKKCWFLCLSGQKSSLKGIKVWLQVSNLWCWVLQSFQCVSLFPSFGLVNSHGNVFQCECCLEWISSVVNAVRRTSSKCVSPH